MTPRKELFIAVKKALGNIPELEYIDLYRKQFDNGKENYPEYWTACLIRINSINYDDITQNIQEGLCNFDVFFYCKDGWMDQFNNTEDEEHGLIEIDILDKIAEELQFLNGEQFKPLYQTDEDVEDQDYDGIMSYRLNFATTVYRQLNYKYSKKKATINL